MTLLESNRQSQLLSDTLIFPCVSIGNIGQLSIDILLQNCTHVQHVSQLMSSVVAPITGNGAELGHPIASSLDLYAITNLPEIQQQQQQQQQQQGTTLFPGDSTRSVAVLQQRAPYLRGMAAAYGTELAQWVLDDIHNKHLKTTIALLGANGAGRKDVQIGSASQFRYMISSAMRGSTIVDRLQQLGCMAVEGAEDLGWPVDLTSAYQGYVDGQGLIPSFLPSSRKNSFLRTMLEKFEEQNQNLLVLVMFVNEGDNTRDAAMLASLLSLLLNLKQPDPFSQSISWKIPTSWRFLSGPQAQVGLY